MKAPSRRGSVNPSVPVLMDDAHVRTLRLLVMLIISCAVFTIAVSLFTDLTMYESLPILAVPFFVVGVIYYITNRRWMTALAITLVSVLCYLIEPTIALFLLYILVCAEGVAVSVELIQRMIFYRVLSVVERVNLTDDPPLPGRIVVFLFNIPCDLDTRNLKMDGSVRREALPWRDMARTILLSSVLCVFLWIYMFLNPAFHVQTTGLPIYPLTIILYLALLVMPWSIFDALDVRVSTDYRDFRLYRGLLETMKRMFLPAMAALVFVALVLSTGSFTLYYVCMSMVMVVVVIVFTSMMYYTRNEADVVNDVLEKWPVFHPADMYSGYDVTPRSDESDFPGTPERDPRSCFRIDPDQKY